MLTLIHSRGLTFIEGRLYVVEFNVKLTAIKKRATMEYMIDFQP